MTNRAKIVFCGEWIKSNMLSRRFEVSGHCSQCRSLSCASGWHSIKTNEFRCMKCFDAEAEHWAAHADGSIVYVNPNGRISSPNRRDAP